jgi:hypothetical protein
MPKGSKKRGKKEMDEADEPGTVEVQTEEMEVLQKTSIQISTKVRDRLWRLKFRKTYDEFLWEMCELYEEKQDEHKQDE